MKKHSGMRPQDIVVLLAIIAKGDKKWLMKDISIDLSISASEVSESLNRSFYAGLINKAKKNVNRQALIEFLCYGITYVFPQQPAAVTRGIPTAFSAPPLNRIINSSENIVWAYGKGEAKGMSIEPLYKPMLESILNNEKLYELLALVDALRIGRTREKDIAKKELRKRILHGEQNY